MKELTIKRPGTRIRLHGTIDGIITQVVITQSLDPVYKCAWWNGFARVEDYLYPMEFETIDDNQYTKCKIGFE